MRQFDVYDAPSEASRRIAPYVAVIQSHFLEGIPTIIVAPLVQPVERPAYTAVSVELSFLGEQLALSLAELAVVDKTLLRRRRGDVRPHEDAIRRGLERVFTGF